MRRCRNHLSVSGGDSFTVPIAEDVAVPGAGLGVDLGALPSMGIAGATVGAAQ